MREATVIDYGVGNLLSVRRGLESCGARVTTTSDPDTILRSSHVVLPGVGAFANAMEALNRLALAPVIQEVARRGTPFLGICLGMQLLLDESEEFGITPGLGLIPGRVVPVPSATTSGSAQKIPHIGWSGLVPAGGRRDWRGTLLEDVQPRERVYFVHSFMADPADQTHRIADCLYGGQAVSAVVGRNQVTGCQFHPEKSRDVGLRVLDRFLHT
jgi:imidazole glycerol-phosphate synthase subunit HisH